MIDLSTGEVEFFGIKVTPNSKLSDYYDCDPEIIDIHDRGNGRGYIAFKKPVLSNNIRAFVTVYFETIDNTMDIEINPKFNIIPDIDSTLLPGLKVELSKKWLRGMTVNGEYQENPGFISGAYSWGYICAQVYPDRDYGTTGGWINIAYEG